MLGGILLSFGVLMYPTVRNAMKLDLIEKWSTFLSFLVLIFCSILLILPFNKQYLLVFPYNFFVCFFGAIWAVIFRITNQFGKNRSEDINKNLLQGFSQLQQQGGNVYLHNFDLHRELHRKILHALAVLYILGLLLHGLFALVFKYTYRLHPEKFSLEEYHNAYFGVLGLLPVKAGFIGLVMGLIGSFFVQIHMEISRLNTPQLPGILKKVLQQTRRATEVHTFSAHIPLIIGFIASALCLYIYSIFVPTYDYVALMSACSVILTASLADMVAAVIGRRYGRKKWRNNSDKTILGTLLGGFTAFGFSILFIGWLAGGITAIVFVLIDLFSNKIRISDNLFYPVILSIIYCAVLPFFTPLLPENWFFISLNIIGLHQ